MCNFTFIVPVHNGMPYVRECLESILNQDNQDFDVVILENCSDDGTTEYLNTHRANSKVKVFPSNNLLSIEENWARILEVPKNKYMIITGADDSYQKEYLSEISKIIDKHPKCSIYRTNMNLINTSSEIIFKSYPIKEKTTVYDYLKGRLLHTYFETAAGYCIKTQDYEKIGGIDCVHRLMHTDDKLMMQLISNSYMAVSPMHVANYRTHPESESGTPNPEAALNGYNYLFNWIYETGNKKLINIVKNYLPYHLTKIANFFTEEDMQKHKDIYSVYGIDENDFRYKLQKYKQKYFYLNKDNNEIKFRFLFIKLRFSRKKVLDAN